MIKKYLLVIFLATTLIAGTAYEEAYEVYKIGDYEKSLKMFAKLLEEEKDNDAAYMLAYMYENGKGCEVDVKKSLNYYKISSRGYYLQTKIDPSRDSQKEQRKLFETIEQPKNKETTNTIKQYVQSLYNIKAHNANYFLPLSSRLDNRDYAKTGTGESAHAPLKEETEFQVSIKYDMSMNLLGFNEIYSIAYTQRSYWQLYTDSAYFRETNYNPEAFITVPIQNIAEIDFLKGFRVGFAHESNGRGGEEERSWNYVYGTLYFQYQYLFAELKLWSSWHSALKYNPELLNYLGNGHLRFTVPYEKHITQLTIRSAFNAHYAAEIDYSYPLFGRNDLFFYLKAFSGYGESLIDYNNKVEKIGFGFSLSR